MGKASPQKRHENEKGLIATQQARALLGFSGQASDVTKLTRLFLTWQREGVLQKSQQRGHWQVLKAPNLETRYLSLSLDDVLKAASLQSQN